MERCQSSHRALIMKLFELCKSESVWRHCLTLVIAAIFIIAGFMKLTDPSAFTQDILQYRMLSEYWSTFVAASLPWLEILTGIALFVRPFRLSASFVIFGLMCVFTVAVALALARGLDIACGCFGKTFQEYAGSGLNFLMRDVILLAASAVLFFLFLRNDCPAVQSTRDL